MGLFNALNLVQWKWLQNALAWKSLPGKEFMVTSAGL